MGLMKKLKKKKSEDKEKTDVEMIGGLLADAPPPLDNTEDMFPNGLPGSSEPFTPGFTSEPEEKPSDVLSSLDIFTEETGEDDGYKLSKVLPDVDIEDLLTQCQEIAALLKAKK